MPKRGLKTFVEEMRVDSVVYGEGAIGVDAIDCCCLGSNSFAIADDCIREPERQAIDPSEYLTVAAIQTNHASTAHDEDRNARQSGCDAADHGWRRQERVQCLVGVA